MATDRVFGAARRVMTSRNGALFAASAVAAAAAWEELAHRRVLRAYLPEAHVRVERLSELRYNAEDMALIEAGLRAEWGDFALLGFESFEAMAREAGGTIFVAEQWDEEEGRYVPKGAVQTILVDAGGDPLRLLETYPTFQELTSAESWHRSKKHGGDTVVLLQITVFDKGGRGGGLGSLLRNAVLNMIGKDVRHALTTTPVDAAPGNLAIGQSGKELSIDDEATYTAAMRFHAHAGAAPTMVAQGFKTTYAASKHGSNVVFMRYERDEAGHWPAPPEMRTLRVGPITQQVATGVRRLRRDYRFARRKTRAGVAGVVAVLRRERAAPVRQTGVI